MGETSTNPRWAWLESLIVLAAALWVLSLHVSPIRYIDEYFHYLAARSYLETQTFSINGGEPYDRAAGFTYAVAACFSWFGESWSSGRLPSLLAGALLVTSVFAWLHRTTGRRAAWLGAGLLLFTPHVITYSQMLRFYAPHMLFVWLAWICAYGFLAVPMSRRRKGLLFFAGAACALIAAHLQTTTAIAALAISAWAVSLYAADLMRSGSEKRARAILWFGALIVVGVPVLILTLKLTGAWDHMATKLTVSRAWTEEHWTQYQYYHRFFNEFYPTVWAVFPFMAVIALAHRRKPAWFCIALFATAFLVHSIMPTKGKRYLSYAWPCLFAAWAIGLDGLLVWLRAQAQAVVEQVFSRDAAARPWVGAAIWCVLIGSVGFAGMVAPTYKYGRKILTGEQKNPIAFDDWNLAAQTLKPIADQTQFVICSAQAKAIYHLGRLDMGLSVSQAQERPEFAVHPKMGAPVITKPASLAKVMAEQPAGLIVLEGGHLGRKYFVPPDTARFILENTQPIELPEPLGVKAFTWGIDKSTLLEPDAADPEP